MPYQSFRDFLYRLQQEGQVVTITKEILPEPDIRTFLRAAVDMGNYSPAVLFDNIKGYKGYRVAGNVHGSWANHAMMLDLNKNASVREQFFYLAKLWDNLATGKLKWVDEAPCQEVVIEKNINLHELLPLFRVNKNDGGPYFSKACVVSQDPDQPDNLNTENVGMYRVMVQGPDTLGMQALPFHDIALHLRKAEERNEELPVAICLGNPPLFAAMAATPLAYDQSEFKATSAFMGQPFEVTKCLGSTLDVPAGSEYIVEGKILPRRRCCEGPFGEFTGSYSGARGQVQIKVDRVTHRKDPIFENLYIGRPWTETDTLIGLWTSVPLYRQIKETMPEVRCVNALYQHGLTIIIATDQRFGGYAKSVAFRIASTPHGISYGKNLILVDGDVDPFNLEQVMWALSMRIRPDKDVTIVANTPGMHLDPCSDPPGMGSKLIIDATTPVPPDAIREISPVVDPENCLEAMKILKELHNRSAL